MQVNPALDFPSILFAAALVEVLVILALTGYRKVRRDRLDAARQRQLAPVTALVHGGDAAGLAAALRADRGFALDLLRVLAQDKPLQDARLALLRDNPDEPGLRRELVLASLDADASGNPAVAAAADELLRALPTTVKV